ncbi:MAG: tetratricopeptide repeat protein, partial [Nitrospira sp.]
MSASTGTKDASPRALLEQANTHEQAKEYEAAIAEYRRFLAIRPDNDDVRATIAKLLSWQGQLGETAAIYQDILTRHPLDDESRVGLARVLSWQHKYADAQREYEWVLREEPQHLDALRGLADVLTWSGHPDQAIPYYERVVAATGEADVVARLRALQAELSPPHLIPPKEPAGDPSSAGAISTHEAQAMERGRRLEVMRQYVDAASVYRDGLQQYPENDDLRSALARLLSWQGAHVEATLLYREVLARHPEDQDVRIALAQILSWQNQFDEAQRLYDQVLQTDPNRIEARRGLAELAHWQGHQSDALARYEALVAETHDPEIEKQLNAVKSELLAASQQASADRTPTILSSPDSGSRATTDALEQADKLEANKQYREAQLLYQEVLQQYPEHDDVRSALARVLSWQGAHAEATLLYREVLARHPEDQDVRIALAQVL